MNADQPNLWTLEQAHYLLAEMHRRTDPKAAAVMTLEDEVTQQRVKVVVTRKSKAPK